MNLINRKNLLLFSLAAETFLASYGLLIGQQTSDSFDIISDGWSDFHFFHYYYYRLRDFPGMTELKKESLSEIASLRINIAACVYHIPLLAGSDPPGSGFCRYASRDESHE